MNDEIRKILAQVGDLDVPVASLADDDDLYAAGLSSMSTVQVMVEIERHFRIELPDELITRDLFSSIAALARAVRTVQRDTEEA